MLHQVAHARAGRELGQGRAAFNQVQLDQSDPAQALQLQHGQAAPGVRQHFVQLHAAIDRELHHHQAETRLKHGCTVKNRIL